MGRGSLRALIGMAVVATMGLSACGSSSDTENLTKADFVRKGNTVCGKWQQARGQLFGELNQKFKAPITKEKKEKAAFLLLRPYEEAIEGLAELDPPKGEENKVEAMIGS